MPIRPSPRFFVAGAAMLVLCGGAGMVLGGFAAGGGVEARQARGSLDTGLDTGLDVGRDNGLTDDARPGASDGAYIADDLIDDAPVGPVICKGCGPTLAQRRAMGDMQGFTDGAMTPDAYGHDERAIDDDVARNMRDYSSTMATPPTIPHSRVTTLEGANGEGSSAAPATLRPAASESVIQAGY